MFAKFEGYLMELKNLLFLRKKNLTKKCRLEILITYMKERERESVVQREKSIIKEFICYTQ